MSEKAVCPHGQTENWRTRGGTEGQSFLGSWIWKKTTVGLSSLGVRNAAITDIARKFESPSLHHVSVLWESLIWTLNAGNGSASVQMRKKPT